MNPEQPSLFDTQPVPWELDAAADQLVATVVLSEGLEKPLDYRVPDRLRNVIEPGLRVTVPLGRANRNVVAYCVALETRPVGSRPLKDVRSAVDDAPLLSRNMLELTRWISDYYLCPWAQAIEAAVPAGVRGQAGTREMLFLSVPTEVAARLTTLKLPPMQAKILRHLAASPQPLTPPQLAAALGCSQGPIGELRKKNLIRADIQRIMQVEVQEQVREKHEQLELHPEQQEALAAILDALRDGRHETLLIRGVTGSGKTEVYIRAIDEVIAYGRQAIVLVPEISLTPQTCRRFRSRFKDVAVLHSHLTDAERHWHWKQIARGEVQVIVGARSALFAPAPRLGLIVIDEEHDGSFKQESVPRYHAREVARRRAELESIPLVLGSATPSLDSWHRAKVGEYRLLDMPHRVFRRPLPIVTTIDMRDQRQGRHRFGALSRRLSMAMDDALGEGGQVILLLNRRGYSTHIQCPACGYAWQCPKCEIALTYHRAGNEPKEEESLLKGNKSRPKEEAKDKAVCHYCDYAIEAPTACPKCRFSDISFWGTGTQRLEAEIKARFEGVSCLRMDSDTMRKPGAHEEALARFRSGEVRILLGTQMIAKGLDFPSVTLVGVINADTALHLPDFRAAERTFQLVTQVSGRTGRGRLGGRVLVQTLCPEHQALEAASRHDFLRFAAEELPVREEFGYPPFASMVRLVVRGEIEATVERFIDQLAERIEQRAAAEALTIRLLGPAVAPIAKLRGDYRYHLLLLCVDGDGLRKTIREATADVTPPEQVQWIVDVDPMEML